MHLQHEDGNDVDDDEIATQLKIKQNEANVVQNGNSKKICLRKIIKKGMCCNLYK